MIKKTLKTQAKDNYGHQYEVILFLEETAGGQTRNPETGEWWREPTNKWVLKIKDTPGSWYMSTLLGSGGLYPGGIAIDYGQKWNCTNFQEVLNEAKELI